MDANSLQALNICQNLDDLMNLDPRGYGVCRILYPAARKFTGKPLTLNAAQKLKENIKQGDIVYIITGFVLLPHRKAEMDGIISSVLLARSLVKAFSAKPVIICPEDCMNAIEKLSFVAGLHFYDNIEEFIKYPQSLTAIAFTKDINKAKSQAEDIIKQAKPKAVISIEAPSANKKGIYHNATGLDLTELEAKTDVLFKMLKDKGFLNIAIGDLGNEIGMGSIGEHLKKYVPYMAEGGQNTCRCGCEGGIIANTKTDNIITATVSDWGGYALIAALAFLCKDISILHDEETQKRALITASEAGMIDMDGSLVPQIDGMSFDINVTILKLMYLTVENALNKGANFETWFEKVLERGFYS